MAEYFNTDWYAALVQACKASSQSKVALRLGVSTSRVNGVLRGRYKGRVDLVAARVRGELMHEVIECPILGEISKRRCLDEQRRPFAPTSPQRVMLFKACRSCRKGEACQRS